jgi:hypothetical protein
MAMIPGKRYVQKFDTKEIFGHTDALMERGDMAEVSVEYAESILFPEDRPTVVVPVEEVVPAIVEPDPDVDIVIVPATPVLPTKPGPKKGAKYDKS